jgi:hypothetical protein
MFFRSENELAVPLEAASGWDLFKFWHCGTGTPDGGCRSVTKVIHSWALIPPYATSIDRQDLGCYCFASIPAIAFNNPDFWAFRDRSIPEKTIFAAAWWVMLLATFV